MKAGITILEHLNIFNKIISKLLSIDVKLEDEDKSLILLTSFCKIILLPPSSTKRTLIIKEGMATLLSNEIMRSNHEEEGLGLVVSGSFKRQKNQGNMKEMKVLQIPEISASSTRSQVIRKGNANCKRRKEWLKNRGDDKESAAVSAEDCILTVFTGSNASHKVWILDSACSTHIFSKKLYVQLHRRKGRRDYSVG